MCSYCLEEKEEKKIFFDESGIRWFRTKFLAKVLVGVLALNFVYFGPAFVESQSPMAKKFSSGKGGLEYPEKTAYSEEMKDPPIIGQGHMQRVMAVNEGKISDPFLKRPGRILTEDEKAVVGDNKYVIEQYGNATGKYIAITFDDGPDPAYTSRILDILAKEKIQATFFVTGKNATKNPELVRRMAREGHLVANHTFTHIDFDNHTSLRDREEIIATDQVIRDLTGKESTYFRIPYNGGVDDEATIKQNVRGILQAQQLGFEVASFTQDTDDWSFDPSKKAEVRPFNESGNIILLHDGGGDRSQTVAYLEELVAKGKNENYKFVTTSQLTNNPEEAYHNTDKNIVDFITFQIAKAFFVLPNNLIHILFGIAAINIMFFTFINIILSFLNKKSLEKKKFKKTYHPLLSVVIAAYNEEKVIEKTVASVFRSKYRKKELIVVNDGSTDNTQEVLKELKKKYKELIVINQENKGKSQALNNGIKRSKGSILVTADADTVFLPDTLANFVRHFSDKRLGAVAGFVKVGNNGNILTMWQALEYISGITLERFAHSYFSTIMITPGACSAWRKSAVIKSGGYSSNTLAEDCDLTLKIQRQKYKTITDLSAIGLTEAPKTVRDLLKQRFRWMYGNLQVLWKHKDMILNPRYKFLGMYILPQVIFAYFVQLFFLPFTYLLIIEHFLSGEWRLVLYYFFGLMVFQFFLSFFAIWISKEKYSRLAVVPIYRIIAEPLRAFLLYASFLSALKGQFVGWNKVKRGGDVDFK